MPDAGASPCKLVLHGNHEALSCCKEHIIMAHLLCDLLSGRSERIACEGSPHIPPKNGNPEGKTNFGCNDDRSSSF